MVKKIPVVWDESARNFLRAAVQYIQKTSPQNAQKVKKDIIKSTRELTDHPYRYAIDKYSLNKDGSYRAYELHHFRIAYFISDHEIRVVRIRHTSQEPLEY